MGNFPIIFWNFHLADSWHFILINNRLPYGTHSWFKWFSIDSLFNLLSSVTFMSFPNAFIWYFSSLSITLARPSRNVLDAGGSRRFPVWFLTLMKSLCFHYCLRVIPSVPSNNHSVLTCACCQHLSSSDRQAHTCSWMSGVHYLLNQGRMHAGQLGAVSVGG